MVAGSAAGRVVPVLESCRVCAWPLGSPSPCLPLAVHLFPHSPLSPGLLSARSAGPCTQPAPLSICQDWGPLGDIGLMGLPTFWVRGYAPGPRLGLQRGVGSGHRPHGTPPLLGPSNTSRPSPPALLVCRARQLDSEQDELRRQGRRLHGGRQAGPAGFGGSRGVRGRPTLCSVAGGSFLP